MGILILHRRKARWIVPLLAVLLVEVAFIFELYGVDPDRVDPYLPESLKPLLDPLRVDKKLQSEAVEAPKTNELSLVIAPLAIPIPAETPVAPVPVETNAVPDAPEDVVPVG